MKSVAPIFSLIVVFMTLYLHTAYALNASVYVIPDNLNATSENQTINVSQLIMAETLFSNFVAEHNLPFVADQKVMVVVNVFSRCLNNFKVNEIVVSLSYKYPILGNLTRSQKYGLKW